MKCSENIGNLAAALAKAQGAMKGATRDSSNPYFKSKYADLASVWEACREALTANELAIMQTNKQTDGLTVVIETTLAHSSGEWMTSDLTMVPTKADPQGIGSCITYARRYALAAMVGVAPEDDDGNAASGKNGAPGAPPVATGLKPMTPVAPPKPAEAPKTAPEASSQPKIPPKAPKPATAPVTDTLEAEVVETIPVPTPVDADDMGRNHEFELKNVLYKSKGVTGSTFVAMLKAAEEVDKKLKRKDAHRQILWEQYEVESKLDLTEAEAQTYLQALRQAYRDAK